MRGFYGARGQTATSGASRNQWAKRRPRPALTSRDYVRLPRGSAEIEYMEATLGIMIDRVHGIEYRALPHRDRRGWFAQWRPARALESFPAFSYVSRTEHFETEGEAMEFIRHNAAEIVARRI